jgi:oxygen-dependent protoporphyrinogen oxidase
MIKHTDTLIIGSGISGLSTAWWLAQRGVESVVLERSSRCGGLIDSTQKDGYLTDHAASMMLNFDASVNQFINTSGLLKHRIMRSEISKRYLFKQGQLIEVPTSIHKLMFADLFSVKTRLKLISEIFRPGRPAHWESVADFIRRRLGQEILDLAIDPYVSAVLACDPEKACAAATLPRLSALERRFGSFTMGVLLKKLWLGEKGLPQQAFTFAGGMKTLTGVISENALSDIQTGQRVVAVEALGKGWRVTSKSAHSENQFYARQIVFSTPADVAASLLRPVHAELSDLLDQIEYAPIAQIHLGIDRSAFTRSPEGAGFLVPSRENLPLRGSLWMSNLIDNRAPQNKLLASNFIGGACQPGALDKPDHWLVDQALSALQKLCGLKGAPEMVRINRHHQGLPLYHGEYAKLTQSIYQSARQFQGLHFVANYLQGISIRDRIIQARLVAAEIDRCLATERNQGGDFSRYGLQQGCR